MEEQGKPSSVSFSVAVVCGLVAITPGSGFVTAPASIIIGLASGIVSYLAANWRANKTDIDDSLDVFACHGVNGIMGSLATGLFASVLVNPAGANGLLYGNPSLFEAQLIAARAQHFKDNDSSKMLHLTEIISKTCRGCEVGAGNGN